MLSKISNNRVLSQWVQQCFHAAIAALIFVLSEWIFTITKPSILSITNWGQKFLVLFHGIIFFSAIGILSLLILYLISLLFSQRARSLFVNMGSVVPAAFLASTILLMIDNFTYTVFRFGILDSFNIRRALYALVFLVIFYFCFKLFSLLLSLKIKRIPLKVGVILVVFLGVVVTAPTLIGTRAQQIQLLNDQIASLSDLTSSEKLPNIILIGSDGLSASHMSVYGYERETTPNITRIAKDSLFVENNFTNSGNTVGSIISILTGKYPTETRVLYPPDMLVGPDAFEHFPAILKSFGYYSVQLGTPYYVDAYAQGVLYGFDEVNGKLANKDLFTQLNYSGFSTFDSFFISNALSRVTDRLYHIFFIKYITDPYSFVTRGEVKNTDLIKINEIISIMESHRDQPVFIQAHLLGTHGSKFNPEIRVFSEGLNQEEGWMTDFYDDSILNFDYLFGSMIDQLIESGMYDDTIIILYSDHGQGFQVNLKTPLIIRFPNNKYKGLLINQSQNLDIAPTILDYLRIEIPEWMNGSSLISDKITKTPVVSFGQKHAEADSDGGWALTDEYFTPPFYQFDYINLVYCQNWYRLELESPYNFMQGNVENYLNPCAESDLLTKTEALNIFKDRLTMDGFVMPSELLERISTYE